MIVAIKRDWHRARLRLRGEAGKTPWIYFRAEGGHDARELAKRAYGLASAGPRLHVESVPYSTCPGLIPMAPADANMKGFFVEAQL